MNKTLKFYLSGIHIADIYLDGESISAASLEMGDLSFGAVRELVKSDIEDYKDKYYLDLQYIQENYQAISDALQLEKTEYELAGQVYIKYGDYENM